MPFEIIFLYHWLFAKEFKRLLKIFAKTTQVVQIWSKNVKLEESNHIYLEILSIVEFKVTYAHLSKISN
jgi:hypothetical protein